MTRIQDKRQPHTHQRKYYKVVLHTTTNKATSCHSIEKELQQMICRGRELFCFSDVMVTHFFMRAYI